MCSKCLGDEIDEFVVIEIASRGDDDIAGCEAVAVGFNDRGPFKALNRLFCPQDRFAQGMIFPEILGEDFVDEVVGIILIHLDFFHDHAAFAGDVSGIKDRD